MDAPPSSAGSSSRYAGVARYLASLEMAGSDLETPPGHHDDEDRPQLQSAGAAKPEMKDDDVTHGSDTSPALRLRRQVAKLITIISSSSSSSSRNQLINQSINLYLPQ